MRRAFAVTPVLLLLGSGVADAADPTLLAETGGFLLGNAHRCGVQAERVERRQGFERGGSCGIALCEIYLASALPNQDPDAFPSCTVVIQQFDSLEQQP